MRTLAALIQAYNPGAGDTIYVDTGDYRLYRNVVLGPQNSGLRIIGPTQSGHVAKNDRGNRNLEQSAFVLRGATDIFLDHLNITGGQYGVLADLPTGSPLANSRLTVSNSTLFDNTFAGISLDASADGSRLLNNVLYRSQAQQQGDGISAAAAGVTVTGNTSHDHTGTNIFVSGADAIVRNNVVYGNSAGIMVTGSNMLVSGNTATGAGNSIGIILSGSGTASSNTASDYDTGIYADRDGDALTVANS